MLKIYLDMYTYTAKLILNDHFLVKLVIRRHIRCFVVNCMYTKTTNIIVCVFPGMNCSIRRLPAGKKVIRIKAIQTMRVMDLEKILQ